jgi:hypothetical protein
MRGNWSIIWAAIEAIGTVSAVIVALFYRDIRDWIRRPRLVILPIESGPPDLVKVPTVRRRLDNGKVIAETDSYYVRMRVRNEGHMRAEEVEVFAAKLLKEHNGEFREVESFIPMNLDWAHRGAVLPGLSPDAYRYCAIAAVHDPKKRPDFPPQDEQWPDVPRNKTILSLRVENPTTAKGYLQPFGTYRLELELGAANARPKKKTLEITVSGTWYDDEDEMFSKGVGIRLLQ